ncbi:MAG: patatin-like phospholipase family protein [Alphaproteobacteria bacterium]|nr:patatin-like phospholipase family protein [Alphaproteobacteria bacterium]
MASRSTAPKTAAKHRAKPDADDVFETKALLLQGGGALGAYQAGVYAAMAEADVLPNWVAGISIGAVNGAIIAGNKPEDRVEKLRGFWEQITTLPPWSAFGPFNGLVDKGGIDGRKFWNQMSASVAMTVGAPGFFAPRPVPPFLSPEGTPESTSYYDTTALRDTLEKFINFGILNSGDVRYTTSAVNVHTGNFVIFDSREEFIKPEHIMASGALPPALPAVEVEGQYYWDGGLISNTPLQWVMDDPACDALVFQVDLWPATGAYPRNMMEVATRQKEIQYSSRTRFVTNRFKHAQKMRHAFAELYAQLPEKLRQSPEAKLLQRYADFNQYNIVHLIYHAKSYEGYSKDFEFSRATMEEHWKAGENDTRRTLRHKEIFTKPTNAVGVETFDFSGSK